MPRKPYNDKPRPDAWDAPLTDPQRWQAYDKFVKSDLHGMAGQKFLDAARVWISAQRKSDKLRPRTLETVAENLRALNKFFKDIRMSSINPGMLKAYQQARLSNAIGVAGGGKPVRDYYRGAVTL